MAGSLPLARSFRAVGFHAYGGPEVIKLLDIEVPRPGLGQIACRVLATVVNPGDTQFRRGDHARFVEGARPPFVPGMDFVGAVEEVGDRVDLRPGSLVAGTAHFIPDGRGSHAEMVVTGAGAVAPLPTGASPVQFATIPMNALTARVVLDTIALEPGAEVLVTGAAGAVGAFVTELGSREGLRITAVSRASDEPELTAMGAVEVVPRGEDLVERLRWTHPDGFAAVVDAAMLDDRILPVTADGGHFITLRPGHVPEADRGITAELISFRRYQDRPDVLAELLAAAARGDLTSRVARDLPPDRGAEAHRMVEAGGLRGRVVLSFA